LFFSAPVCEYRGAIPLRFVRLKVFVATRREDVPANCAKYISVDGAVPGAALTWDHHQTGERINLEAMPDEFDPSDYDGVGTTLADADALSSVVAVMAGGKALLPARARAVLESASFWCDHLRGHPEHDAETNRIGRGLLDAIDQRIGSRRRGSATPVFAALAGELGHAIDKGSPLPFVDTWNEQLERADRIVREGRLVDYGDIALVDLRGAPRVDPAALYARHDCPVAVHVERHDDGGFRYTVGIHPGVASAPSDLGPALIALARAEYEKGAPALSPGFGPGTENWGGRARVFGSPWNYGSRLTPDEIVTVVRDALGLARTDDRA
jgi:hypothetical protein